ncbi:MAG: hypothetical protein QHJ73_19525, partial [Armatimonadota bacterium]|nr:hypothetical protein [Armatimonadota bacterium]
LVSAMTLAMGQGLFSATLLPAAHAAPQRQESVVVFEVKNDSGKGGEGLAKALTRQIQLAIDQSKRFGLVAYSPVPPYSPSVERALKDGVLSPQDLAARPELPTALKIGQVLGADLILLCELDQDSYKYDAAAKTLSLSLTGTLYSVATGDPVRSVSVTGVGTGEGMQGALEERARVEVARLLEAKLDGRDLTAATPEGKKRPGVRKWVWWGVGAAAVGILAATIFSGGKDKGPAGPVSVVTSATRSGVRIAWTPPPGVNPTAYRIYRATVADARGSNPSSFQLVAEVPGTVQEYVDTSAPAGATARYIYRVAAVSNGDEGPATVAATPVAPGKPSAVTGLQASVDQRSIQLTWNANPEDFVTAYRVYRSTQMAAGFSRIAEVPASQRTFTDESGLAGGTTYFYKVTAVGPAGQESDLE